MKKLLSLTLVLTLILGTFAIFPASAVIDETTVFEKDGYRYYLNEDGTANFSGCTEKREELIIPAEIDGHKIVAVYGLSVNNKKDLKSVTIPEGVVEMGYEVFRGCLNVEKIHFPDSLTNMSANRIENTKFYRTEENWEDGVLYAGNHLVAADPYVVSGTYTVKEGTTVIDCLAFQECYELTEVIFPQSLKRIDDSAFNRCDNLAKADLPEGLESIGTYAFSGCALKEIRIPSTLKRLERGAFRITDITEIEIPPTLERIGDEAFADCDGLTEVTIPEGVKEVKYSAFSRCDNLAKITLPESLAAIGNNILYGTAYYNNEENWENGGLYIGDILVSVKSDVVTFNIKEGTRLIPRSGFSGFKKLSSVTIPESVDTISPYCFSSCYNLRAVNLPATLKTIGEGAFSHCLSLESIHIPEGVTEIGAEAFFTCEELKYIEIPKTVETFGNMALGYYNPYFEPEGMPVIMDYYPTLSGFILAGYTGTAAEAYAVENSVTFEDLAAPTVFKYKEKVLKLLEGQNICHYEEVYEHFEKGGEATPDFVLIRAYSDLVMEADFTYYFKDYVMYEEATSIPAEFGYFVYLPEENKIYTLVDAFEKDIENVYDLFTEGVLGDMTGDVNFDGKLNIRDATLIQKDVANKASVYEEYYMVKGTYDSTRATKIADYNRDGKFNIRDATAIQKRLAGVDLNDPDYEDFENGAYENIIKHAKVTIDGKTYDLRSDEVMHLNVYLTSSEIISDLTFEHKVKGYINDLAKGKEAEFVKNHLPSLPEEYRMLRYSGEYLFYRTNDGEYDFTEKKLLYTMDYKLSSENDVNFTFNLSTAYSVDGKTICLENEPKNGADIYLSYEVDFERIPLE